jgi:hypothetical protein
VRAAAVFATFSSRAGASAATIFAYDRALAIMKDADLNNLNPNQLQAKQHLETNRTKGCACCRYTLGASSRKKDDELNAHLTSIKNKYIGTKCRICGEKFVDGDQPIMEGDHRDQSTKLFCLSQFGRIQALGGIPALELELLKCDIVHMSCHRIRSFLQRFRLLDLDDYAIPIPDSTLRRIAEIRAKRNDTKTNYVLRRKLEIGKCECGTCDRKVTEGNFMCLDFAHKPELGDIHKVACVGRVSGGPRYIEAEIAKCRLLFCECHKKLETDPGRFSRKKKLRGL